MEAQGYDKLVEALRHLSTGRCDDSRKCELCAIYETCLTRCVLDAADAIVALGLDNEDYEHENRRLHGEIEALQAVMKTYGKTAFDEGYAMGFAAGEDRAEKQMPKRGEIVRCGECKWWHDALQCSMYSEGMDTSSDWFCADGEREVQDESAGSL